MPLHVEAIRGVTRLDRKCRINYDRFLWTKHCREAKIIRERLVPFIKSNLIKLLIFIARMNFNNKLFVNTPSGKAINFYTGVVFPTQNHDLFPRNQQN